MLGYFRLIYYWLQLPLHLFQFGSSRLQPQRTIKHFAKSPALWDEGMWLPLPWLDQFLLLVYRQDQKAGLAYISQVAQSFRQGWAAQSALASVTADRLQAVTSGQDILQSLAAVTWLPDDLAPLGRDTLELYPGLQAVGQSVAVALEVDSLYSQRLSLREAQAQLDALLNRTNNLGGLAVDRWEPVISQWQQVITAELVGLTAGENTAAENPYQVGNPLQRNRAALFKGRTDLRDGIVNSLLERNRPTLVLHGPRRMGKSSFLLQLPGLIPGHTIPVFIDLQRPIMTTNTSAFLFHTARSISRDAKTQRVLLESPQRDLFDQAPYDAFEQWLEVALSRLGDFNLLLTFDEFEKLGEAVQNGRIERALLDELRHLIQHESKLAFLFAGVHTLDELGPDWSSYFINVKPMPISYLQPDEAQELITNPDPAANFTLTYVPETVETIMAQTRCQPYLVQLVCSALVEEANAAQVTQVDMTLLDKALVRALGQGNLYFSNVWIEDAGVAGQPLLRQLARGDGSLSFAQANEASQVALERLVRRQVICTVSDGYEVEIPLVKRWIREYAPRSG